MQKIVLPLSGGQLPDASAETVSVSSQSTGGGAAERPPGSLSFLLCKIMLGPSKALCECERNEGYSRASHSFGDMQSFANIESPFCKQKGLFLFMERCWDPAEDPIEGRGDFPFPLQTSLLPTLTPTLCRGTPEPN